MNFSLFLKKSQEAVFWHNKSIICFMGKEYPFYFFLRLFENLAVNNLLPYPKAKHVLFFQNNIDVKQVIALLQETILGQPQTYWLGSIDLLCTGKQRELLVNFLLSYKGPNQIIFFTDQLVAIDDSQIVTMPQNLKKNDYLPIVSWYENGALKVPLMIQKKNFLSDLFTEKQEFSLDTTLFLLDYLALISVRHIDTLQHYLEKVIASDYSLMDIAESFFLKKGKIFFEEWYKVESEYPPVFWLMYWSDYVWRAYWVVVLLKSNRLLDAKKMGYKMPYSFMSYAWKNYSPEYLSTLYKELYNIDFKLKQGSLFACFELFFLNHFLAK